MGHFVIIPWPNPLEKTEEKRHQVFSRAAHGATTANDWWGLNTPEFDSPHQPFVFGRK
jgi:hypothetical protein